MFRNQFDMVSHHPITIRSPNQIDEPLYPMNVQPTPVYIYITDIYIGKKTNNLHSKRKILLHPLSSYDPNEFSICFCTTLLLQLYRLLYFG